MMSVLAPWAERGKKLRLASFSDRYPSLYGKGRLDVEAKRVIKRRRSRKTNEIPIEPRPVETQRIGHQHRLGLASDSFNPATRLRHGRVRTRTFLQQSVPVEPIHA